MPGYPQPRRDKVIKPGQLPTTGRLTMPIGTHLPNSTIPTLQPGQLFQNPSTAALGQLGGPQPTNLPQFPSLNNLIPDLPQIPKTQGPLLPELPAQANQPVLNTLADYIKWYSGRFEYDPGTGKFERVSETSPTGIFNQTTTLSKQADYLMNFDTSHDLAGVSARTLQAVFPGKSFEDIQALMESKGYAYTPGAHGHPGIFILSGQSADSQTQRSATGALLGPNDTRGRPEWVDPTTLAPGERVQVSSGASYVGGTPTKEGTSQYALTVSQTLDKKREAAGDYKWVSKTVKDKNGNWVRIYSKQLRKVATHRGQVLRNARAAEQKQQQPQEQSQQQASQDFAQLVTLRVNYG